MRILSRRPLNDVDLSALLDMTVEEKILLLLQTYGLAYSKGLADAVDGLSEPEKRRLIVQLLRR